MADTSPAWSPRGRGRAGPMSDQAIEQNIGEEEDLPLTPDEVGGGSESEQSQESEETGGDEGTAGE